MSLELRPGETVAETLPPEQAGLVFIGRIATPWAGGGALDGVEENARLAVLYWLQSSRRRM